MDIPGQTAKQEDYVSYLLRMWRESAAEGAAPLGEAPWRASLQSPRSGDLVGFASLDDLFEFLRRQAGVAPASGSVQNEQ